MCLSPSKAAAAATRAADKAPEALSVGAQEESNDASEERVLSAGLFPPEEPSGAVDSQEASEDRYASETPGDREHSATESTASECGTVAAAQKAAVRESDKTKHDAAQQNSAGAEEQKDVFTMEETLFVFDWDDTLLPSTWLQRQKLRLDSGSTVSAWQREQLVGVENTAIELIRNAKQCGKVVLVTNAERGWIELSCQKFLPALLPLLENVKAVSARTTFESRECSAPLEWKLRAFEREIRTIYGTDALMSADIKKNVLSLGDSVHEREALMQATRNLPSCHPKSLKFVERPDISQIIKQHSLVNSCFHRVVHQEGLLDLCIKCT